jgi:exopolysaccharide biosynthesis polyprenyl glycosylphosphotransferase
VVRRHTAALHLALMATDALGAMALFVLMSAFVTGIRFPGAGWRTSWDAAGLDPMLMAGAYATVWVSALWIQGLYRLRVRWSFRRELMDILRSSLLVAVATFTLLFLLKLPDVSRFLLVALFAAQIVLTVGVRAAIRWSAARMRSRGLNARLMLVVGTGQLAREFADRIERHVELGLRVIGLVALPTELLAQAEAAGPAAVSHPERPVLGLIGDIEDILHEHVVDEIAICLPVESIELAEPLTRLCEEEGRVVRIPYPPMGFTMPGARQDSFDGIPMLSLVYGPDRIVSLLFKRLLDLALATAAIVVLSPFLLAVALWIRLVDGGPVLFRQARVGLHGRVFTLVKFRTMVPDAEARLEALLAQNELKGHVFKLTNDPRLSRSGRWLRRTSIDELPQLWNVLRGEMSLVGPRPPLPREVAGYDIWHRRRLSMKPGITGLWQVSARHEEDFDRWVELDLDYIDGWSLWLDLKIMFRTIPAMLQGR